MSVERAETGGVKRLVALMFTDMVGSVELQRKLGTEAYTRFVRRHDAIFKQCLERAGDAAILNETGDGFLVRFSDPSDALNTALRLQYSVKNEICEGEPLRLRIGLHLGMVTEMEETLRRERRMVGMAINLAARVMDLGSAGQILMTRAIYDDARHFVRQHPAVTGQGGDLPVLRWLSHGHYRFKGGDEPLEIFEVGAEGIAPLTAPESGAKADRVSEAREGDTILLPKSAEVTADGLKESDVYISFASVDDRPLSPGQTGWISQFHRNLETRMEQLSGEPIKVVRRAPVIDEPSADELLKAVPEVKAMVSVVSPPFVRSTPCVKEAEAFWKSASEAGNLWLDERTRLLKVVKTPVMDTDVPESLSQAFSGLLSFDFYTVDPETGRVWEFDETFGVDARRRYYERVYDLAYELCHILRTFQSGQSTRKARAEGQTVYLAETTGDLREARDRLKRELMERGHIVLPDRPLPLSGPELEAAVRECIRRCSMSVHLVGSVYGLIPEAADRSVVELQNKIAAEYVDDSGDQPLGRLIWLPRERSKVEPRQAEFISHLMEDATAQRGADVIEGSLEEFKEILIEELTPKKPSVEEKNEATQNTDHGAPRVYLICDRSDEEAVETLEDYLFDQGFEVTTPTFEGSESEIAALHRQKLVHCDAAVIYYGGGSKGWVETKLMDLQQAAGYGRKAPFRAKVVYLAPPFDRRKERFRTHQATVIRSADSWDPQLFSSFVSTVKDQAAE